jgi:hypothetical protein
MFKLSALVISIVAVIWLAIIMFKCKRKYQGFTLLGLAALISIGSVLRYHAHEHERGIGQTLGVWFRYGYPVLMFAAVGVAAWGDMTGPKGKPDDACVRANPLFALFIAIMTATPLVLLLTNMGGSESTLDVQNKWDRRRRGESDERMDVPEDASDYTRRSIEAHNAEIDKSHEHSERVREHNEAKARNRNTKRKQKKLKASFDRIALEQDVAARREAEAARAAAEREAAAARAADARAAAAARADAARADAARGGAAGLVNGGHAGGVSAGGERLAGGGGAGGVFGGGAGGVFGGGVFGGDGAAGGGAAVAVQRNRGGLFGGNAPV